MNHQPASSSAVSSSAPPADIPPTSSATNSATNSPTNAVSDPRPPLLWRLGAGGGIAAMVVLSTSDRAWERAEPGLGRVVPRSAVRALLGATVAVHVAEAVVATRLARRAQLPVRPWATATLCWGFPVLLQLRRARAASAGDPQA
ncbi:MAG: DUF4499 domain-containing protein [Acidimicrobiia bacterium]|nr:DUF4499 domain-containing protein [Acidimicrobiia bacterium]